MKSLTLDDFRHEQAELESRPLRDKRNLIRDLGNYYLMMPGSEIESSMVLESEKFLNELYISAQNEGVLFELQDYLMEATGTASYLSYAIKQQKLDDSFFTRIKKLGSALVNISNMIS